MESLWKLFHFVSRLSYLGSLGNFPQVCGSHTWFPLIFHPLFEGVNLEYKVSDKMPKWEFSLYLVGGFKWSWREKHTQKKNWMQIHTERIVLITKNIFVVLLLEPSDSRIGIVGCQRPYAMVLRNRSYHLTHLQLSGPTRVGVGVGVGLGVGV